MKNPLVSSATLSLLCVLFPVVMFAQDSSISLEPAEARVLAEKALQDVSPEVDPGLEFTLWASDTLVADPVTLFIDDEGRAYVTRTFRKNNSEFDIRGHTDWMIPSISLKTVEDRRAFLREELAPRRSQLNTWLADLNGDGSHDWRDLLVEKEQVYRIEDSNDDGLADRSTLIMEDFHEEITDVAGAVLYHNEELFVGVGPDMWRMRDTDGDDFMDWKESISHGYAIHIGFGAHGMSGLIVGPDGRIYWGIGDIGFYGTDKAGRLWDYSNQGVIVRANPDGSDFEVFAAGLRNTHEFVFDAYGNLISVDNDGDHPGERERLVYIVNGSDTGWRTNWQFGKYTDPKNNAYKVWMDEEYFKPRFEGQAAHLTPPIALYHAGPAGMVYNPGTALGQTWKDYFFVSQFVGSPARSKVHAFRLRPDGASFALQDEKEVLGNILTTGMEFGIDGALYAADWINGWGNNNKGRIWKLDVPSGEAHSAREEVKALLPMDFNGMSNAELAGYLRHPDMRIRQKAQFALATKGSQGARTLEKATHEKDHQLARIHGIWGLGQLAREDISYADLLIDLLEDQDPEIRAQAAKTIGDVRYEKAVNALLPVLEDEAARPRFFAAEALGRIKATEAIQAVIQMLANNDDEDAYLRHAGALALARIGDADPLLALADHPSPALRTAAVVALRRMQHPGITAFLQDEDARIVTDVARAINDDASIPDAIPALAAILDEERFNEEPLVRRAINANSRLGSSEAATRLARYAARVSAPAPLRAEALAALAVWESPSVVDRVDGTYRGPSRRDGSIAQNALGNTLDTLLQDEDPVIRSTTLHAIAELEIKGKDAHLERLFKTDTSAGVRAQVLKTLNRLKHPTLATRVQEAFADPEPAVKSAAIEILPSVDLPANQVASILESVLENGSVEEKQAAITALGELPATSSEEALTALVRAVESRSLETVLHLEVYEAVEKSGLEALGVRLDAIEAADPDQALAPFRMALEGGNRRNGGNIFNYNDAAQCTRCHVVGNRGANVGPALNNIGSVLDREALLRSLVDPSARMAPGYGLVSLQLLDGNVVAGTLMEEQSDQILIVTGNGEQVRIDKEEIQQRTDVPSSMPAMGNTLSLRELRDLVEYLANLD